MTRLRRTHRLSATRREQVGEDDYGSPIYDDRLDVIGGTAGDPEPVRYIPEGTTYRRLETGERVQRMPRVRGRAPLAALEEGDRVTLVPVTSGREAREGLEVRSIDPQYGRGGRVESVIIELEDV